ncbi:hypothetical protein ACA910_005778 [Epithemia clementina (nom. ined.)]
MSSGLSLIGSYFASKYVRLFLLRGSVLDFGRSHKFFDPQSAAIVNAANEGCLGGGGVDGAITHAGGPLLEEARLALPVVAGNDDDVLIRCPTGKAVITGPNKFGDLAVPYVIHAVGPNYFKYNREETPSGHPLLRSAYQSSLDLAYTHQIQNVGFALLSAGLFKGPYLSLRDIMSIGLDGLETWTPPTSTTTQLAADAANTLAESSTTTASDFKLTLPDVYLCCFTQLECNTLIDLCDERYEKCFPL